LPSPPPSGAAVVAVASDAPKPTILVAEKLGEGGVEMLREVGTVDCSYDMSKDELLAKISLVDAIVIRSATKVQIMVFVWSMLPAKAATGC
jgi:D-3-phosphoglycerate dehydrogenase